MTQGFSFNRLNKLRCLQNLFTSEASSFSSRQQFIQQEVSQLHCFFSLFSSYCFPSHFNWFEEEEGPLPVYVF